MTRRHLLLALLYGTVVGAARAQEAPRQVKGQSFAPRVQVAGEWLLLNGTGVRAVAWFKAYAAGLYLTQRATTTAQALALAGPKRLQLRMLRDLPAAEFVKALKKGIERNTAPGELPALSSGVQQLADQIAALDTVRLGDVVDLDLDPALGLLFSLNGTPRGKPVADAALYAALLRAFIGDHPYDKQLKAGLLARPENRTPAPAG